MSESAALPQALQILFHWLMPDAEPQVETEGLARVLRLYIDRYRAERPSTRGRFSSDERGSDCDPMNVYEALAFQSGLDEDWLRKLASSRRPEVVDYADADALVQVIGEPVMFSDGTITLRDPVGPSQAPPCPAVG